MTTSRIVEVTPAKAKEFVATVDVNRVVKDRHVARLAGAMRRGEWIPETSIIYFSNNEMIDGQHRCLAIIKSGVTIRMRVVYDAPKGLKEVIDTGIIRQFKDLLKMRGEINSVQLASGARLLWMHLRDSVDDTYNGPWGVQSNVRPTHQQLFELLEAHPNLRASVSFTCRVNSAGLAGLLAGSIVSSTHYLVSSYDPEAADYFFEHLASGADLHKNEAIFKLREILVKDATRAPQKPRMAMPHRAALVAKAWNSYIQGQPVGALRWRTGGPRPEMYPALYGVDYEDLVGSLGLDD